MEEKEIKKLSKRFLNDIKKINFKKINLDFLDKYKDNSIDIYHINNSSYRKLFNKLNNKSDEKLLKLLKKLNHQLLHEYDLEADIYTSIAEKKNYKSYEHLIVIDNYVPFVVHDAIDLKDENVVKIITDNFDIKEIVKETEIIIADRFEGNSFEDYEDALFGDNEIFPNFKGVKYYLQELKVPVEYLTVYLARVYLRLGMLNEALDYLKNSTNKHSKVFLEECSYIAALNDRLDLFKIAFEELKTDNITPDVFHDRENHVYNDYITLSACSSTNTINVIKYLAKKDIDYDSIHSTNDLIFHIDMNREIGEILMPIKAFREKVKYDHYEAYLVLEDQFPHIVEEIKKIEEIKMKVNKF